jgi:hypothetical protein
MWRDLNLNLGHFSSFTFIFVSCGESCDLVEHDDPATRAPVLQAIEELARTSRTSTEL